MSCGSLLEDREQLIRFTGWLRGIGPLEGYPLYLMIRSRGLRDKFGFKGSDHVVAAKLVHGYLTARVRVPGLGEVELWRLRFLEEAERLAVLARCGRFHYVRYKPGSSTEVEEVLTVPWQLLAVYTSVNPVNVLRAALSTVREVQESVWKMAESRKLSGEVYYQLYRRPDTRYYSNAMRHTVTRFHTVDVDSMELAREIIGVVQEELGYRPALVWTGRGVHLLVELPLLDKLGVLNKWVGPPLRELSRLVAEWKRERSRALQERIRELALAGRGPLFHRLSMLGTVVTSDAGSPLVEVKKKSLEPVPGMMYKGSVVVRFETEVV